jgi:Flp pilus assembly CpaF family ATPase
VATPFGFGSETGGRPPKRTHLPHAARFMAGGRELADLVERMLRTSGRRIHMSTPFVDATMPDGSRLHVVIPDMIEGGASDRPKSCRLPS